MPISVGARLTGRSAQRVDHGLARRAAAVGLDHRQHREPRARVVVAVDPRDREEVRQLPEKDDAEQHPGALRQLVARRRPADDRRQRAGNRADDGRERGAPLERRVDERVRRRSLPAPPARSSRLAPTARISSPATVRAVAERPALRAWPAGRQATGAGACAASARRARVRSPG